MVIMQDSLPGLKRFLKPVGLNERMAGLVIRCIVAFVMHFGRMAATRAATAVRSEPRHRAQVSRFLGTQTIAAPVARRGAAWPIAAPGEPARGYVLLPGGSDVGQSTRRQDGEYL